MQSHLSPFRHLAACLVAVVLTAICACGRTEPQAEPKLERVVTTITPLNALIRPLLPPAVTCTPIIGPGHAVHGHQSTPAEIVQARNADVVFGVGAGIDSAALDAIGHARGATRPTIVFSEVLGVGPTEETEHDETHDGHDHHGAETHLWLDPVLAASIAEHAAIALADRAADAGDQALASDIRSRAEAWITRIHAMDAKYREALAPFAGRTVLTTHPAFGLLLERYGLHELSFSPTSPHAAPSPAQLAEAVQFATSHHASAIFTEPQAPRGVAETVAQRTGLPLGTLDPLGADDWEAMMLANLDALVAALGIPSPIGEPTP